MHSVEDCFYYTYLTCKILNSQQYNHAVQQKSLIINA